MAIDVYCSQCRVEGYHSSFELSLLGKSGDDVELKGLFTCKHAQHRWPIHLMNNNLLVSTAPALPVAESSRLEAPRVPDGIFEDVEEAEQAHFDGGFKASTVMCRRALQLALEHVMNISEAERYTLGPLLNKAKRESPALLGDITWALADRVKEYGDGGAHERVQFDAETTGVIIHDTVVILNELYPPPTSQ